MMQPREEDAIVFPLLIRKLRHQAVKGVTSKGQMPGGKFPKTGRVAGGGGSCTSVPLCG